MNTNLKLLTFMKRTNSAKNSGAEDSELPYYFLLYGTFLSRVCYGIHAVQVCDDQLIFIDRSEKIGAIRRIISTLLG